MNESIAERMNCLRCNHKWVPKDISKKPNVCPKCNSAYWNRPIQNKGTSEKSKAWWKENAREMSQKAIERIANKKRKEREAEKEFVYWKVRRKLQGL